MDAGRPGASAGEVVEMLRLWVLGVLGLGLVGTVTELLFLEHYEEPLQFVPLVLIASAIIMIVWHLKRHDTASLRGLQIVMGLFVLAGFVGIVAHFRGSAEFQLELNPDLGTWDLLQKIVRAQAPPLLAPGMMMQLGLLGLAYAYTDARYRRSELP
jgi:hypothetical protein